MLTEEMRARLENTLWRAEEGLDALDKLINILDEDTYDKSIEYIVDLKDAWLGGIKYNVEEILSHETKED